MLTHAHADHARPGSARYLVPEAGLGVLRKRLGEDAPLEGMPYGVRRTLGDGVVVSFHPAGHVLGSAQVRVEAEGEVWVVTGDYKRAPDPTCAPFESVPCDVLLTEATFALPVFRWRPTAEVVDEVVAWWERNAAAGRTSVLYAYALGKAPRLLAELASRAPGRPVHLHGAIDAMMAVYRASLGTAVAFPDTARVVDLPKKRSLAGELVLAPLSARRSRWEQRLGEIETGFVSGHMAVRGTRRRRAFDRGFALSDHADWEALLRTVRESGARRVLATHGHALVLARYLEERLGLAAEAPAEGLYVAGDPRDGGGPP